MEKAQFIDIIKDRSSVDNIASIATIFDRGKDYFIDEIKYLKDGSTTSVFDIGDDLVLKIFDRRRRQHPRVYSPYLLPSPYFRVLRDTDDNRVVIEIERKLWETAPKPLPGLPNQLSNIHQEVLRMLLWMDGYEFWDVLPPPSNSREIKNVLLDANGVPYGIDEDAVRIDPDKDYPRDTHGKRTLEHYLDFRKNSYDRLGRPDAVGKEKLAEIQHITKLCSWPQGRTIEALTSRQKIRLNAFKRMIEAIPAIDDRGKGRV